MKVTFFYNNETIQVYPIEISFCHRSNEYGQVYVLLLGHYKNPIEIEINNLFKGKLINSMDFECYKIMYFVNSSIIYENFKYEDMHYDTFTNTISHNHKCEQHNIAILNYENITNKITYKTIKIIHTQEEEYNDGSFSDKLSSQNNIIMDLKLSKILKNLRQYTFIMNNDSGIKTKEIHISCLNMKKIQHIFMQYSRLNQKKISTLLNISIKIDDLININDQLWKVIEVIHHVSVEVWLTTLIVCENKKINVRFMENIIQDREFIIKNNKILASPLIYEKIFQVSCI